MLFTAQVFTVRKNSLSGKNRSWAWNAIHWVQDIYHQRSMEIFSITLVTSKGNKSKYCIL